MQIESQIYELEKGDGIVKHVWHVWQLIMLLYAPLSTISMLFLLCDFAMTFVVILQQFLLQSLLWSYHNLWFASFTMV
jgi:hypothetical protein